MNYCGDTCRPCKQGGQYNAKAGVHLEPLITHSDGGVSENNNYETDAIFPHSHTSGPNLAADELRELHSEDGDRGGYGENGDVMRSDNNKDGGSGSERHQQHGNRLQYVLIESIYTLMPSSFPEKQLCKQMLVPLMLIPAYKQALW
ncbi:uncharacterized protein LOC113317498 isoform X2 [Papaver somniferum]|uniref:uncharacterized protein LOC113317498 isoform X2 n=1 Tax=Papaver somniferum TaxID=3469 RepID=UPI000E7003D9|nr:uncharacterized protein LOC113317498 isoform X2 [Papaver somniferum]XP_026421408.1 uncharacterized protein LOC113317498 isoform X2 [Papaver somniferum]